MARRTYNRIESAKQLAQAWNWLPIAYHGVLPHENDTLATETQANLVHLLRADIVDGDNEDGLVFLKKALEPIEVSGLGL